MSGAYSLTKRARTHNFICSSFYGTVGGLWPPDLNFNVAVLTRQIIFFLNKISTAVRFTAKFCSCPLAAEGCLRCWPSPAAKKPQGQRNWRQEEAVGLAIPSFASWRTIALEESAGGKEKTEQCAPLLFKNILAKNVYSLGTREAEHSQLMISPTRRRVKENTSFYSFNTDKLK